MRKIYSFANSNHSFLLIFLVCCVIISPILIFPGWRLDDTSWILDLLKNSPWHFSIHSYTDSMERFLPLFYSFHQMVANYTFSPHAFFTLNYTLAISSVVILMVLLKINNVLFWCSPLLLVFIPSFSENFYRFYGDKEPFFLWSLFLLLFFTPILKTNKKPNRWIIFSIIPGTLALYFKEPGFIMLTVFAITWLVNSNHINPNKRINQIAPITKSIIFILIISSLLFLLQYIIFTEHNSENSYLTSLTPSLNILARLKYSFKALILYSISDPLLIILLPFLIIVSHFKNIKRNFNDLEHTLTQLPVLDSLAIASFSYVLTYIALGFHGYRYLLPAYPFGIIAIAGYLSILSEVWWKIYDTKLKKIIPMVVIMLLINGMFSSFNTAVFYKVSSYNFMQYTEALIHKIDDINSAENTKVNFYLPGKKDIGYIADRHRDILNFYEVNINSVNFEFNPINQNWIEQNAAGHNESIVNRGDFFLITPNSTISQDQIMANLQGLKLREIMRTQSPNYFEIPEIRHFLKYLMLQRNPDALVHQMIYREVDFAIYQVI